MIYAVFTCVKLLRLVGGMVKAKFFGVVSGRFRAGGRRREVGVLKCAISLAFLRGAVKILQFRRSVIDLCDVIRYLSLSRLMQGRSIERSCGIKPATDYGWARHCVL